jgi:hypothetical protein
MIWYRHWLELRQLLVIVLVVGVSQAPYLIDILLRSAERDAISWRELGLALRFHWVGLIFLAAVVGGASLRSAGQWLSAESDAAIYYTLTLPASRRRLLTTRLAAVLGGPLILSVVLLTGATTVGVVASGVDLPVARMATGWAVGMPIFLFALGATSLVATFTQHFALRIAAVVLVGVVAVSAASAIPAYVARGEWPILIVALCASSGVAALAYVVWREPRTEY